MSALKRQVGYFVDGGSWGLFRRALIRTGYCMGGLGMQLRGCAGKPCPRCSTCVLQRARDDVSNPEFHVIPAGAQQRAGTHCRAQLMMALLPRKLYPILRLRPLRRGGDRAQDGFAGGSGLVQAAAGGADEERPRSGRCRPAFAAACEALQRADELGRARLSISVSVGSISMAPWTTSGKYIVIGW
jgi:hypothetical protein